MGRGWVGAGACRSLYGVGWAGLSVPRHTVGRVTLSRQCSKTACGQQAVATLTYVYAEQTAVLGPLATYAEPHSYDLCGEHAQRLTAPRGWEVVRLEMDAASAPVAHDDLVAIAEAVRERREGAAAVPAHLLPESVVETGRRGHLRVLRDR